MLFIPPQLHTVAIDLLWWSEGLFGYVDIYTVRGKTCVNTTWVHAHCTQEMCFFLVFFFIKVKVVSKNKNKNVVWSDLVTRFWLTCCWLVGNVGDITWQIAHVKYTLADNVVLWRISSLTDRSWMRHADDEFMVLNTMRKMRNPRFKCPCFNSKEEIVAMQSWHFLLTGFFLVLSH